MRDRYVKVIQYVCKIYEILQNKILESQEKAVPSHRQYSFTNVCPDFEMYESSIFHKFNYNPWQYNKTAQN